jgi:hypothetical protein
MGITACRCHAPILIHYHRASHECGSAWSQLALILVCPVINETTVGVQEPLSTYAMVHHMWKMGNSAYTFVVTKRTTEEEIEATSCKNKEMSMMLVLIPKGSLPFISKVLARFASIIGCRSGAANFLFFRSLSINTLTSAFQPFGSVSQKSALMVIR